MAIKSALHITSNALDDSLAAARTTWLSSDARENAVENSPVNYPLATTPGDLRHFLTETDRAIMKFVVDHDGQFYNADLAKELGVDTRLTCFPFGRITRKLQKVGVKIEGAKGENWYTKHRATKGTLLNVRADFLLPATSFNPAPPLLPI